MFGRTGEIGRIRRIAHDVHGSDKGSIWCFLGGPGAGKTSVLKCAQRLFLSRNWLCGYSEASADAATAIDEFLADVRHALPGGRDGEKLRSRLTEISVSFAGFGAAVKIPDPAEPPSYARVRDLFAALAEMAKKAGTGVALLIDEAQAMPARDLDLLLRVASRLDNYPFVILMAGLPGIPRKVGGLDDDRPTVVPTWFSSLQPLSADESYYALAEPAAEGRGTITFQAARRMAAFAEGHPLTLQMVGSSAWDLADQDLPDGALVEINEAHADAAIQTTSHQLVRAYHEPAWAKCKPDERAFLARLAAAPARVVNCDDFLLAARMEISGADDIFYNLYGRGIVALDTDRTLRFAIPAFRQFAKYWL